MKSSNYKVVILGESSVGKSSLVLRFVRNQFHEKSESTIGAAFLTQTVQVEKDVQVKLEMWDTAGQERYHSLAPMYYRGAHAAIVVYDVTSRDSFFRARNWVRELSDKAEWVAVRALTGNKIDMVAERAVSEEEGRLFAEEEDLLFTETSAKMGTNVVELFSDVAIRLPEKCPNQPIKSESHDQGTRLSNNTAPHSPSKCKC